MTEARTHLRPLAVVSAVVLIAAIGATLWRFAPGAGDRAQGGADATAQLAAPTLTDTAPDATPSPDGDAVAATGPADGAYPAFDLVRIPPDGLATVAGRAAPMAHVDILVDGEKVAETEADARGEFVALFDLEPSGEAREMRIETEVGGIRQAAEESILIGPATPSTRTGEREVAQGTAPDGTEDAGGDPSGGEAGVAAEAGAAVADAILRQAESALPATAEAPATVLRADDAGVAVLQQPGTRSGELRVDAVTYDPEGRVFVSGRAGAGVALRIYLDNGFLTAAEADEDGQWREELAGIAPGRYTLRVDQIGGGGDVLARAELPFQREDVAVLAELTGTSPSAAGSGEGGQGAGSRIASVTVQPGNTLWGIATSRYGEGYLYARVFDANRDQIRDPDLIYPGQIFVLPEE
ncbi:LysM peptidoglycan-binding domain-containing protein [Celeribacter indicus]|uniref:LysM domain-containing protein n=1 Tax=Celeribacter indicus TaxID=1208324 RepID=A0A0B5E1F5_9RHOB|nr:LysM peptidoglycan-binding domain-containing protein [Celeribacter indicus]AJE47230.1 lysM domain-containing protein [Celeribacter indicus]SDW01134.1 LysM domain-containing protein [Celeribacter indicus]